MTASISPFSINWMSVVVMSGMRWFFVIIWAQSAKCINLKGLILIRINILVLDL